MLSRLVITFLPRSKRLLISWLQSPSAVILEPRKIKSDTVSPSISHEVMGPDASCVQIFVTPWTAACQASLYITNSQSLLKLMSIQSVMPYNHLMLCRPLLLPPSIFPSIRVFSNESSLHIRWPKYWSFSFSKSPSSKHSGLISFRMDWLEEKAMATHSSTLA